MPELWICICNLCVNLDIRQRVCKSIIDWFFLLLLQIVLDIFFGNSGAFFFSSLLESGEFFFVSAGADKGLFFAFFDNLHLLVAVWAAGIAQPGNGLPVAAFPVLAYQEARVLSVDRQHPLAASWTLGIGQIIMAEGTVRCLDLLDKFLGVILYLGKELGIFVGAFGNVGKFQFPLGRKFRLL